MKVGFTMQEITRARLFCKLNPTGLGPYTHSKGYPSVRQEVADFIARRDGYPADPEQIFLSNGASSAIKDVIQLLSGPTGKQAAFMIPIPQYPLYSAALVLNSAMTVGYELDEEKNWSLSVEKLEKVWADHCSQHPDVKIKALVVISPSNPTGAVLPPAIVKQVIGFCARHDIVMMADEVY